MKYVVLPFKKISNYLQLKNNSKKKKTDRELILSKHVTRFKTENPFLIR